MKGTIQVKIYNNQVKYEFSLNRKYSVLTGGSSTGKSSLNNMLSEYIRNPDFKAITTLECMGCEGVLAANTMIQGFYDNIKKLSNMLIVLDEGDLKVLDVPNNAEKFHSSDNYFLIISREKLAYFPYSHLAIYQISTNLENNQTVNRFSLIYGGVKDLESYKPEMIITEDAKSGNQFFKATLQDCIVESAKSKSNIKKVIKQKLKEGYKDIYVIADGAAFGSEISSIARYLVSGDFKEYNANVYIHLPESFEYLLLKTYLFKIRDLKNKLENTQDYCEANKFISWERYYTKLLESSQGYDKSSLDSKFLTDEVIKGVYNQIVDLDKSIILLGDRVKKLD